MFPNPVVQEQHLLFRMEPMLSILHDRKGRIVKFGKLANGFNRNQTVPAAVQNMSRNIPLDGMAPDEVQPLSMEFNAVYLFQIDDRRDKESLFNDLQKLNRFAERVKAKCGTSSKSAQIGPDTYSRKLNR